MNLGVPGEGNTVVFWAVVGAMAVMAIILMVYGYRRRWFGPSSDEIVPFV